MDGRRFRMRADMVNSALILLCLSVLVGIFRVYAGPLATPLLGLAALSGLLGTLLMWLGLTQRPKEELERLPEEAQRIEASSGVYEVVLLIVVVITLAVVVGALLLATL